MPAKVTPTLSELVPVLPAISMPRKLACEPVPTPEVTQPLRTSTSIHAVDSLNTCRLSCT